jgi:hypothetical protein
MADWEHRRGTHLTEGWRVQVALAEVSADLRPCHDHASGVAAVKALEAPLDAMACDRRRWSRNLSKRWKRIACERDPSCPLRYYRWKAIVRTLVSCASSTREH